LIFRQGRRRLGRVICHLLQILEVLISIVLTLILILRLWLGILLLLRSGILRLLRLLRILRLTLGWVGRGRPGRRGRICRGYAVIDWSRAAIVTDRRKVSIRNSSIHWLRTIVLATG
jgi:hypothetical protein